MRIPKETVDFTCEKCGECCRVDGFVYLKKGELRTIAGYLAKPIPEVKKNFTEWVWFHGRVLQQDKQGCIFLVDGRCIIYPARPEQCSEYPFWKEGLYAPGEWEYFKTFCPGARNAKIKQQ